MKRESYVYPNNLASDLSVDKNLVNYDSYHRALKQADIVLTASEKFLLKILYDEEVEVVKEEYSLMFNPEIILPDGCAYLFEIDVFDTVKYRALEKIKYYFTGEQPDYLFKGKGESRIYFEDSTCFSAGEKCSYCDGEIFYVRRRSKFGPIWEKLCINKEIHCLYDDEKEAKKHDNILLKYDIIPNKFTTIRKLGDVKLQTIICEADIQTENECRYDCNWTIEGFEKKKYIDTLRLGCHLPADDPFLVSYRRPNEDEFLLIEINIKYNYEGFANQYNFHVFQDADKNYFVEYYDVDDAAETEFYGGTTIQNYFFDCRSCDRTFRLRSNYATSELYESTHGKSMLDKKALDMIFAELEEVETEDRIDEMYFYEKDNDQIFIADYYSDSIFQAAGAYISKYEPYIRLVETIAKSTDLDFEGLTLLKVDDEYEYCRKRNLEREMELTRNWFKVPIKPIL